MSKPTNIMWGVWVWGLLGPEFQLISTDLPKPVVGQRNVIKVGPVDMDLFQNSSVSHIASKHPLEISNAAGTNST